MKKRLTDTEIWDKPWFRKLSPADKCAIMFIKDKCDNVGVWIPDTELAQIYIGSEIEWETLPDKCNGNIVILDNEKWWMPDFTDFQWGYLDEAKDNKARQSYICLLKKHGLWERYLKQYERSTRGLKDPQDNKRIIKEEIREVMEFFNKTTGRRFENSHNLKTWLGKGFTVKDCKLVISDRWQRWCGTEQEEYVRPSTLFRPSHFTEYLAEAKKKINKVQGNNFSKEMDRLREDKKKHPGKYGIPIKNKGSP